jgi:molecular chaperone IbpA
LSKALDPGPSGSQAGASGPATIRPQNATLLVQEGCNAHAHCRFLPPVSLCRRLRPARRLARPGRDPGRTDENAYRIEIAVAGFRPDELTIEVRENLLTVTGRKAANDDARKFLHRGLAERNFERRFQLADYVIVTDAALDNGLLSVSLKRELPEALKPRTIAISTNGEKLIEAKGKKAA